MKKVNLGTVWCAYQPPVQIPEIVLEVDRECYNPLFKWLAKNNGLRVNIAINKSLEELLIKNKCTDTLDNLGIAVQLGSVELMASFAYHPFSPLIIKSRYGKDELKRQNEVNDSYNRKIFGKLWNPEGFYLPEFGYSDDVGELVRELGYEYAVTNGLLYFEKNKEPQPFNKIVTVKGLNLFFTSDWSRKFALDRPNLGIFNAMSIIKDMFDGMCIWFDKEKGYTVWGGDIETMGHHNENYGTHTLEEIAEEIKRHDMDSVFLSELRNMFPEQKQAEIFPGTQSTSVSDIYAGEFFPLWMHSKNPFHQRLWDLEDYAMNVINVAASIDRKSRLYRFSREELDKGLFSCKAWQANPDAGHFIPWLIRGGVEKIINSLSACYFIMKENNAVIEIGDKKFDAEEMLRQAKDMEYGINELICKEEIKRKM